MLAAEQLAVAKVEAAVEQEVHFEQVVHFGQVATIEAEAVVDLAKAFEEVADAKQVGPHLLI